MIEHICGIYKIQSKLFPDRFYIGSSSNIKNRWRIHKSKLLKNEHHSIKLQRHLNKYGLEDLEFTILEEILEENKYEIEQSYLNNLNPYFNILKSSLGVETGHVPWNKGVKTNITPWNKGIKCPQISIGLTGHKHSEETKLKISSLKKGKKYYRTFEERNKKLSIPVNKIDRNTKEILITYDSLQKAEKDTNIRYQHISDCCRKIRKTAGNFIWEYT